jgi:D,D-heptose 1,7-bisphosphate phosphatase
MFGGLMTTEGHLHQRRALFLDRDGTINAMVYNPDFGLMDSPANPDEFILLPGVSRVVRAINEMGLLAIVISNQPGVAKGKFTEELLEAMTDKMHRELSLGEARLDAVYYCLHHPEASIPKYKTHCDCRKPKPGLLLQAAREWEIDLRGSYFIGDGITDVLAGQAAGTQTILISSRKPYLYEALSEHNANPNHIVASLDEAMKLIQEGMQ